MLLLLPLLPQDATARVREAAQALGKRQQLRQANLQPARPGGCWARGRSGRAVGGRTLAGKRSPTQTHCCLVATDDSALKGLDSSMKRNTALTRKLRQLSEDTRQSILDDIAKTNQSKVGVQGWRSSVSEQHRNYLVNWAVTGKDSGSCSAALLVCSTSLRRWQPSQRPTSSSRTQQRQCR